MTAAKQMKTEEKAPKLTAKEKLAALKAKAKQAKEAKPSKSKKEVSVIANETERKAMAQFGVTAVLTKSVELGLDEAAEVRVDNDACTVTFGTKKEAIDFATNLYAHIKAVATRMAKGMADEK